MTSLVEARKTRSEQSHVLSLIPCRAGRRSRSDMKFLPPLSSFGPKVDDIKISRQQPAGGRARLPLN